MFERCLIKFLEHRLQRHGLGHEVDLHHHVGDLPGPREKAFRIDVAHDVVDRLAPDEDTRIFRVNETRRELFDRCRQRPPTRCPRAGPCSPSPADRRNPARSGRVSARCPVPNAARAVRVEQRRKSSRSKLGVMFRSSTRRPRRCRMPWGKQRRETRHRIEDDVKNRSPAPARGNRNWDCS